MHRAKRRGSAAAVVLAVGMSLVSCDASDQHPERTPMSPAAAFGEALGQEALPEATADLESLPTSEPGERLDGLVPLRVPETPRRFIGPYVTTRLREDVKVVPLSEVSPELTAGRVPPELRAQGEPRPEPRGVSYPDSEGGFTIDTTYPGQIDGVVASYRYRTDYVVPMEVDSLNQHNDMYHPTAINGTGQSDQPGLGCIEMTQATGDRDVNIFGYNHTYLAIYNFCPTKVYGGFKDIIPGDMNTGFVYRLDIETSGFQQDYVRPHWDGSFDAYTIQTLYTDANGDGNDDSVVSIYNYSTGQWDQILWVDPTSYIITSAADEQPWLMAEFNSWANPGGECPALENTDALDYALFDRQDWQHPQSHWVHSIARKCFSGGTPYSTDVVENSSVQAWLHWDVNQSGFGA